MLVTAVVVPAVVLIMLISLLCVAICVVHKFRRQEPTMYVTKSSVIFCNMCFTLFFNLNNKYDFTSVLLLQCLVQVCILVHCVI